MTPFRVLQISIVVVLLFGSTWVVGALGMAAESPGSVPTWLNSTPALAGVLQQGDNDDNNDDGGDNSDNSDNSDGGDNSDSDNDDGGDNDGNSNGNGNDSDYDDNENYDDFDLPPLTPSGPTRPPEPQCAHPGQDTTFTSYDGKVNVKVFASTPEKVRVEILQVIDFLNAPLPPGAEVNLAIHYNDIEATGLDESRFVIGKLDMATAVWNPMEKRANDPSSNVVTATIIETGFYMVWEQR
jgi:hypothetical protein